MNAKNWSPGTKALGQNRHDRAVATVVFPAPGGPLTTMRSDTPPMMPCQFGTNGPPCPLRPRQEEYLRTVMVAYGQTSKILAGHGIARSEAGSAIEFPS